MPNAKPKKNGAVSMTKCKGLIKCKEIIVANEKSNFLNNSISANIENIGKQNPKHIPKMLYKKVEDFIDAKVIK
jgi:hypothetical protein